MALFSWQENKKPDTVKPMSIHKHKPDMFLDAYILILFGFIFYFTMIACYLYFWAGKMDGVKKVLLKMGSNVSTAQQNNFLHPFFCREMLHSSCIHPTTTGISIKSSIYNQKTWLPLFIWATIVKINTLHFL